jgi:DinB family protein
MMRFDPALAIPVLERTPAVLRALLEGLPSAWTDAREGPERWSPFDVVGHLIHGERTDWIPRAEMILGVGEAEPFPAFDREAMFRESAGKSLAELLDRFARSRSDSVARLRALALTPADLARRGRHPEFGPVTLEQHLATWVAHDLSHIRQIVRTMGREYAEAVGPWAAYLPMLRPEAREG